MRQRMAKVLLTPCMRVRVLPAPRGDKMDLQEHIRLNQLHSYICYKCGRKYPETLINVEGVIHHRMRPQCIDTKSCNRARRKQKTKPIRPPKPTMPVRPSTRYTFCHKYMRLVAECFCTFNHYNDCEKCMPPRSIKDMPSPPKRVL